MLRDLRTLFKSTLPLSVSLLLGLPLAGAETPYASFQTPDEYFHEGAKSYIFSKNSEAKAAVEAGLKKYPDHPKLQELARLLQDQENQQNQKSDDKKDDQKQESSRQDQKQDPQKQEQKDRGKQEEQQQEQQENQKSESQPQDQKQAEKKEGEQAEKKDQGDQPEDQKGAANMARPIQMTPQEAQRLLDALKSEEKAMIFIPPRTNRANRVFKDW